MNWAALGDVLPQAVAIAVSPIPIVLVILVLVSPRARTSGPGFVLGWVSGLIGVTALVYALADGAGVATDPGAADSANLVQIGLGVLFLFMAYKQWGKRPRPGVEPKTPKLVDAIAGMPPLKVLGVGFASASANPKNLPLAISAGITIATGSAAQGTSSWATVAAFGVVASSVVIVAVIAVLVLGEATRRPLEELKAWLIANGSTIMMVVFVLLAAKMIGSGLAIGT